jgi:hypothetical protein
MRIILIFGLHFDSQGDAKGGYKFKKETCYFLQNHLPARTFLVFDRGEIKEQSVMIFTRRYGSLFYISIQPSVTKFHKH